MITFYKAMEFAANYSAQETSGLMTPAHTLVSKRVRSFLFVEYRQE